MADVDNTLTRCQQLLREQIAEPDGGLDHPRPVRGVEPVSPRDQFRDLAVADMNETLAEYVLAAIHRDCCVVPVVGIDTKS